MSFCSRCGLATKLAGTVLAAVVLVSACSGGSEDSVGESGAGGEDAGERRTTTAPDDAGDSEDPTEPAESTTDLMAREQETVEDAYVEAMRARIDSASPPNPSFSDLAETHVDPYLDEWKNQLERWAFTGHVVRYRDDPDVTVLSVAFGWDTDDGPADAADEDPNSVGNLATLQACIVDGGQLVHQPTGKVEKQDNTDSSGLVTVYEHATMKKVDGVWKLAERRPDKDWPGRAGCAVAGSD